MAEGEADGACRWALRAAELRKLPLSAIAGRPKRDRGDDERCRLLLALGEAETKAGQGDQAVEVIEQALKVAERLDDGELTARAALAHNDAVLRSQHAYSGRSIPILRPALERLGEDDSPARARLLAALAGLPPPGA